MTDVVAEILTRGALASLRTEGMAAEFADQFLKVDFPSDAREGLEIAIAERLLLDVEDMALRCRDLARLVLTVKPGKKVVEYLSLLSRCYVAGFDPETIVMCRSALDNAIRDKYERTETLMPQPALGKKIVTFREVLADVADRRKWLSEREKNDAWGIWDQGGITAHREPHVARNVIASIKTTLALVEKLTR